MSKEMVISANPHETRVAIMEEGQLCEYYVEREKEFALVGSIYKGRVTRVLPGMQSAFVEIGLDSDAFLYVSDFLEDLEEFDHIVTTVEEKVQKMEAQGGQVFAAETAAPAIEPSDVEPAPYAANEVIPPDQSFPANVPVAPERNIAPPISSVPVSGNRDRGGFENRRHDGRREGRFGQRGGRGGGRHGGRPGGGRGDRPNRFSRELPQSKYASSRSYEDHPGGAATGEGSIQTILPGESLAKYKERPPAPPASVAPVEETASSTNVTQATPELSAPAIPASTQWEPAARTYTPARTEFQPSTSGGLEPLPGESLSKWKTREHSAEERSEAPAPALEDHQEAEHRNQATHESHSMFQAEPAHTVPATQHFDQVQHPESIQEDNTTPNLSEEEAIALAEQVAEAQAEEAARNAQQRVFAAQEDSQQAGVSDTEVESAESEEEQDAREADAEEEAEEAQAEAEGMIAHPAEMDQAEGSETDSMHAESGSHLSAEDQPAENQPPQEQQPWKAQVRGDFRARMQHPARRGGRGPRRDDRGRRPQHGHSGGSHGHHRPQPRRTQLIADMLKQGQEIIVQIAKEPLGKKGARITSHVALPGRYLVYMPTLDHTGVSRKIASAEDRARLRHLVNEAKGAGGGGFIVRTAASSATPDEIRTDVEFLMRTWAEIKSRSEQRKAPSLLHRDLNLVERILRDYMSPDYTAVWVDTEEEFTKVVDFMSRFQPQLVNRVKLYTKDTPVFEEFGIQQEIDKGLRPKVWLKSGGYIVINHTEALVAIDVNTGKFVGKGSNRLEDTIVRTNLEAVKEIVRQMRLRDLGGIIIIDFIDMEERRNREKVMAALEDALRADRAPSKVLRFNEFGLVAITRKRTKQALERTLCQPCPYCTGSGMVKSIPTLCYEIQCEARKMAAEVSSGSLTLRVHPEISKALKTRESSLIEELEQWTKKSIIIQADPTLHWEQYDIY
jgi:Rne/Rng family ribonuclease